MIFAPSRDHVGWVTDTPAVGKLAVGRPDGSVMIRLRTPPIAREPAKSSPSAGGTTDPGTVVVELPLSSVGGTLEVDDGATCSVTVVVGSEKRASSSSGLTDVQLPVRTLSVSARPIGRNRTRGPYSGPTTCWDRRTWPRPEALVAVVEDQPAARTRGALVRNEDPCRPCGHRRLVQAKRRSRRHVPTLMASPLWRRLPVADPVECVMAA